ncbi:hypothetical protein ACQ4WX_45935 [Streptomyces lasalocidi]
MPNADRGSRRQSALVVHIGQATEAGCHETAPRTTATFDVDFGHTDPRLVISYGERSGVGGPARRITVTYRRHWRSPVR